MMEQPEALRLADALELVAIEMGDLGDPFVYAAELRRLHTENERMRAALTFADVQLTNMQPHIPQACQPGKEPVIDAYVDTTIEAVRAVIKEQRESAAWDGECVLGHCNSPSGCEDSNCCRASALKEQQ